MLEHVTSPTLKNLMRAPGTNTDFYLQVHEEVLRLFTATVGKLSTEQLAKYLQMTLQHSRKSRK